MSPNGWDAAVIVMCWQVDKNENVDLVNSDVNATIHEKREQTRAHNNDQKRKQEIVTRLQKKRDCLTNPCNFE